MTVAGALLALAGVALISIGSDMHGSLPYVLAILGAAAISAYATVELKKFAASDPFLTLPPAMLIAGVTMTLAGAVFEHPDWARGASPSSVGAILYLARAGQRRRVLPQPLAAAAPGHLGRRAVHARDAGDRRRRRARSLAARRSGSRSSRGAALVIAGMWLRFARRAARRRTAG